jgi:hypothetical protein
MYPERIPAAVGVKVIDKVHVPAAVTPAPQLSVSAKSPLAVIDEMDKGALPMFRSSVVCAGLVDPDVCNEY